MLLENEKGKYFFEFDIKEIVREPDLLKRYEAYKTAKETGFITLNEIRREENREDIKGLDVVNVGLGAVLYDTNTHTYYTPNTDTTADINGDAEDVDKMLENHELAEEYDASGNNPNREASYEDRT
jgi:hypothetical protein